MKTWEDIVKDKLEEYESPLPEGSLATFRARRTGAASNPAMKRFPVVWMAAAAVAAGLAAFLFLRHPAGLADPIRTIQPPVAPDALVSETIEIAAPVPINPIIARASKPKAPSQPAGQAQESQEKQETRQEQPEITEEEIATPSYPDFVPDFIPEYIPQTREKITKGLKIGTVAGALAGGGLLAVLAGPYTPVSQESILREPKAAYLSEEGPDSAPMPEEPKEETVGSYTHYLPIKAGLSVRMPVSDRFRVTTGLEYAQYISNYTDTKTGKQLQQAHYLGIPIRLDCSLLSGRRLDLYAGAGVVGDICLGATLDGTPLQKDGFAFSVLGAIGLQWNLTNQVGIYLEPEISWTKPTDSRILVTYRTAHPVMFSIATGLRINLGK